MSGVYSLVDEPARRSADVSFRTFAEEAALSWQSWKAGTLGPDDVIGLQLRLIDLEAALSGLDLVDPDDSAPRMAAAEVRASAAGAQRG